MTQPGRKHNHQKKLDRFIERLQREGRIPKLLPHSCCALCGGYVLEYLSQYFGVTMYYYNPDISPEAEYKARVKEQGRLIREMAAARPIRFLISGCEPEESFFIAGGHGRDPEERERCHRCYELRLDRAAKEAMSGNFDFFTTTLSISPLKSARWLNDIGCRLAGQYGILYLASNFKKKNGHKRSVESSALYGFYHQDYCGYVYSQTEA